MDNAIVLQDPRKFTVQVTDYNNEVCGTAFVIWRDDNKCLIATCKHVIEDALVDGICVDSAVVNIYFPQLNRSIPSEVIAFPKDSDDDIAILRIQRHVIKSIKAAVVGPAHLAHYGRNHEFSSFGYRSLGDFDGLWTYGNIRGEVNTQNHSRKLRVPLLQLHSDEIHTGMSGAPVFDLERNLVVGIISAKHFTEGNIDNQLAEAVDCLAISLLSDLELFQDRQYPLKFFEPPKISDRVTQLYEPLKFDFPYDPYLYDAPIIKTWAERPDLFKELKRDFDNSQVHVISLYGFAGEGKSFLARKWLDEVAKLDTFDGVIWLAPTIGEDIAVLMGKAIDYLIPERNFDSIYKLSLDKQVELVGKIIINHKLVFVLDGIDSYQQITFPGYGELRVPELRNLIDFFLFPSCKSKCIITSRAPLSEYSHITFNSHLVGPLNHYEAIKWLHNQIKATDTTLNRLVSGWNGYPFALSIIAAQIHEKHGGELASSIVDQLPQPERDKSNYDRFVRILKRSFNDLETWEQYVLTLIVLFGPISIDGIHFIISSIQSNSPDEIRYTLNIIADNLYKLRLVRKNVSGEYDTHELVAKEAQDLITQHSEDHLKILQIHISRYYFSEMKPRKGFQARQPEEIKALYYLYCALGLIDQRTQKAKATELIRMKRDVTQLPNNDNEYIIEKTYILIKQLGNGASGKVWLAYQYNMWRCVALKFVDPEFRSLSKEFDILPSLHNPYIVPVHAGGEGIIPGETTKYIFFVMPYLSGGTLKDRMSARFRNNEQFTLAEIADLLNCVAKGLDYLHKNEIIHEDIKPANIVYDEDNIPVIVDFGFARVKQSSKTSESDLLPGTKEYVSPEKWRGDTSAIAGASDQYSLAVIVYEMITQGKWPYGEVPQDRWSLALKVIDDPPIDIWEGKSDLEIATDSVLRTALKKNPQDRYKSVQAFANAFADAINQSPDPNNPTNDKLGYIQDSVAKNISTEHINNTESRIKKFVNLSPIYIILLIITPTTIIILSYYLSRDTTSETTVPSMILTVQDLTARFTEINIARTQTRVSALVQTDQFLTATAEVAREQITVTATDLAKTATFTPQATQTALPTPLVIVDFSSTSTALAAQTVNNEATLTMQAEVNSQSFALDTLTQDAYNFAIATQVAATRAINTQIANDVLTAVAQTATTFVILTLSATPTIIPPDNVATYMSSNRATADFFVLSTVDPQCLATGNTEGCVGDVVYISESLTTIHQYRDCYRSQFCLIPNRSSQHFNFLVNDPKPVVDITWEMAYNFCNTYGGRLPTELEWENILLSRQLLNHDYNEWTSPTASTTLTNITTPIRIGRGDTNTLHDVDPNYYEPNLSFRCVFEPAS